MSSLYYRTLGNYTIFYSISVGYVPMYSLSDSSLARAILAEVTQDGQISPRAEKGASDPRMYIDY